MRAFMMFERVQPVRGALVIVGVVAIAAAAACQAPAHKSETPAQAQAGTKPAANAEPAKPAWSVSPQVSDFSAPGTTAEPQLTAWNDRAVLSWVESSAPAGLPGKATLKFSERTASGWSTPVEVGSGDNWFVNSADLPSVLRTSESTLAAHWLVGNSEENDEAYDLKLSFSSDNGHKWSAPVTPHHDRTKTQHGFGTLYNAPSGGLGVVWLDGRGMPSEDVGSMQLRSASFDAKGKQQGGEALIDDRVCECCSTSVAITADGPLVAYRDRSMDNVRDIHVSRLENGKWTPSVLVHEDGWTLPACPINGPAVVASGQTVAVAWFTTVQGKGHTFVAFSNDAGRTFAAPVQVDDMSSTGRVDVALLKDGSAAVSWVEFANEKSQLEVRRVAASGEKSPAQPVTPTQTSGYPRMVRRGDELVMAWTESDHGMLHVKAATAALPAGF